MKYLSTDDVTETNQKLAQLYDFKHAVINFGNLDFCISSMADISEISEKDATIRKAARVCYCLIRNHCFLDGNKRTAFEVMHTFLNLNSVEFKRYDVTEIFEILTGVSAGMGSEEDILSWLHRSIR